MSEKLPKGWKKVKLGEICKDISYGYTASAKSNPLGPKFLRITDIVQERINWDEVPYCKIDEKKAEKYKLKIGDIVIARTGATTGYNKIIKNNINSVFASYLIRYRVNSEIADPFFVWYNLQSSYWYGFVDNIIGGSAQPGANAKQFADFDFYLPPLPEQKAIASVLSSLDDKIDLLHRQNQTLEQMAQTLFRKWFIEEVDDEWERKPLKDFLDFKEGPGIRNWQYKEKGIPFINIRLISNGEIDLSKANYVSEEEAYGKYSHFLLQRKDMIISTSGTLGKSAIIRNYHLPLLLNTSVIRFRPKDGVNYSFMYCYLRSDEFYESLVTSASGSVQLNFGPTHLKQIEMIIPPENLLEEFRKIVDPIYEKVDFNFNQIRTLEKLRDTLLPKLMSGEVRVSI